MAVEVDKLSGYIYSLYHYKGNCPTCSCVLDFFKGDMNPIIHYVNKNGWERPEVSLAVKCPICGSYLDENFNKLYVKIENMI